MSINLDIPVSDDDMTEKAWLESRMADEFEAVDTNASEIDAFISASNTVRQDIFNNESLIDAENIELEEKVFEQAQDLLVQSSRLTDLQDEIALLENGLDYVVRFTLGGDLNQFFPIAWARTDDKICRVVISRGSDQDTNLFTGDDVPPGIYFDLIQKFNNSITDQIGYFRIISNAYTELDCVKLPSDKMFTTLSQGGALNTYAFQNEGYSGLWLRGALTYTIVTNDPDTLADIQYCLDESLELTPAYIWDDNKPQALVPGAMTIPTNNTSGNYVISWVASTSPLVSYVVEKSVFIDFNVPEIIYTGGALSLELDNIEPGTYYYRIKATKSQYDDSPWVLGLNPCAVTRTVVVPNNLYVQGTSDDGEVLITWPTSSTPGVTYTLEQDTSFLFEAPVEIYNGINTSHQLVNEPAGTYVFRIKATKPGYSDSSWKTVTNTLVVTKDMTEVTNLVIPGMSEGIYSVTWDAILHPTEDITYTIEESTDMGFVENLVSITTAELNYEFNHNALETGEFYYRVKASKVGWTSTEWLVGENACIISKIAYPPTNMLVPIYNETGSYIISWTSSVTGSAIYELEEATNIGFTDAVVIATQTGLSFTVTGRTQGNYFYRARCLRTNYQPSAWETGVNSCNVVRIVVTPTEISLPTTNGNGNYEISWGCAMENVLYTLQEAMQSNFSDATTVYVGTSAVYSIFNKNPGTYYYRVKASRDPLADSLWRTRTTPIVVSRTVVPVTGLSVPIISNDGEYDIAWEASSTPGAAYEVQESQSSNFTAITTIYSGTDLSCTIFNKNPGTYYYRVRTVKSGWTSMYTTGLNPCLVERTVDPVDIVTAVFNGTILELDWSNSDTPGVTYTVNATCTDVPGIYYTKEGLTTSILIEEISSWIPSQYTFNITVVKPDWASSTTSSAEYTYP